MRNTEKEPLCYDNEIWKDIPEYEGLYEASSLGRIRTKEGKTTHTEKHGFRHWESRIMKGRGNNYYTGKRVGLWKDGVLKDWLVARLVAITFLGYPTKEKNTVNHINGNRLDNRIDNLEWLSIGDNVRHAFETGLMPYKKIKLYNENSELVFRSKQLASFSIGRCHGYISNCIKLNKDAVSVDGIIYKIKIVEDLKGK